MSPSLLELIQKKEIDQFDDYIQVPVYNEIYYDFVMGLADKYLIKPQVDMNYAEYLPFKMTIHLRKGNYHYNMMDSVEAPDIPLDELESVFDYLKNNKEKREKEIIIAGHVVKFNDDGSIAIGCTSVGYATISRIYKDATKKHQTYIF
jgi:hypothetical protein